MSESRMSERSETESERDLDGIDVVGYNFFNYFTSLAYQSF